MGEHPEVVSGQVFHFKLGSFSIVKEVHVAKAHSCLKLKTWLGLSPTCLNLSMIKRILFCAGTLDWNLQLLQ